MIGTLLGVAASIGSQVYGGIKASNEARKADAVLKKREAENQAWYDREYNADATQRADAQRILNITAKSIKERNRAAQGAAAVMGATEEGVAATKEAGSQALADAAGQIAASGEARKDALQQQYMATKAGIDTATMANANQRAANIAEATKGATAAAGKLGLSLEERLDEHKKGGESE